MSTPIADAALLRQRARSLRRLAEHISDCEAITLRRRAGTNVWIGPTPAACSDELLGMGRRLLVAADDLIVRATRLDSRATTLETMPATAVLS
jgi:hypothetical protein